MKYLRWIACLLLGGGFIIVILGIHEMNRPSWDEVRHSMAALRYARLL
ncbi:MAG: hypothetical protein HY286_12350 [Planctomycetes bacterium]|nr:hypothetical protein [Planctomycetota bacterium]